MKFLQKLNKPPYKNGKFKVSVTAKILIVGSTGTTCIAHDRNKEFHWKIDRPVAAKMIQLQNPLLRFLKTTKGNFSGEDF